MLFSAVTKRSKRTTEGFSSPATWQSSHLRSIAPVLGLDVTRAIKASWSKSKST